MLVVKVKRYLSGDLHKDDAHKNDTKAYMQKGNFTKEILNVMTSMIISASIVVASVMMMFIIFITTIMLIGIVFNTDSISGNNVSDTYKSNH